MFDRFGEMNSWEEINELAANLKAEGDLDGLKVMAKENGIPEDFVDLYTEGMIPMILDGAPMAAGCKLDVECAELKPQGLMEDWTEYIRGLCFEEPAMAAAVRKKGKSLKGCMAKLLRYSFENRVPVDKDIVKEAKISAGRVDFGVCGMKDAKRMIREYYLEGAE